MFDSLDTSASALLAQRQRMDTIANNIANINTTRDADNKPNPFRRRFVVFSPGQPGAPGTPGVHVKSIETDRGPFRKVLDWNNPDHDANGYVSHPNIDMAIEMVNAMDASRAYEANVTAMEVTKSMMNATLRLLG